MSKVRVKTADRGSAIDRETVRNAVLKVVAGRDQTTPAKAAKKAVKKAAKKTA